MNDYVAKPIRVDELVAAIKRTPRRPGGPEPAPAVTSGPEAIDTSSLVRLLDGTGGDKEFVGELVDQFLKDAPGLLDAARKGLAGGEVDEVRRAAHTLKSNAATFGARDLSDRSRELEDCAKRGISTMPSRRSSRSPTNCRTSGRRFRPRGKVSPLHRRADSSVSDVLGSAIGGKSVATRVDPAILEDRVCHPATFRVVRKGCVRLSISTPDRISSGRTYATGRERGATTDPEAIHRRAVRALPPSYGSHRVGARDPHPGRPGRPHLLGRSRWERQRAGHVRATVGDASESR